MTNRNIDRLPQPAPRLIVDLAKIQSNYKTLQAMAPHSAVGAVVKANAYGLGATEVVPALADAGCKHFYVAHMSEGEEARRALKGVDAEIFVFNGFWPAELPALREFDLFPVINDLGQARQLREIAPDLPCAIHFDSGINRLGLDAREAETYLGSDLPETLKVRQHLSHLACADDPKHALNATQLERFRTIAARSGKEIKISLANSAGTLLGSDYHFDVLRPGLALYGGAPNPASASPFQVCVQIEAPILQLRKLQPGDQIGYGATWTADKPTRTATVAAGYADGILRACGEGGIARLNGQAVPILGRVSMDLISVDLSNYEGEPRPGDPVCFLSEDLDALANHAGAISYELLVRLGLRFNRVYRR
ncbi:alanine racemase [Maricaulis sp.]|uniref:alanine racemase n=1 Tax=unclassified Maricaulis TaxID=2632371 RepID=UPI001B250268|nr:alanine racemase [Maricaulis sp.]MBO6798364.1 alanine racemase [Maricaulis sp.]